MESNLDQHDDDFFGKLDISILGQVFVMHYAFQKTTRLFGCVFKLIIAT